MCVYCKLLLGVKYQEFSSYKSSLKVQNGYLMNIYYRHSNIFTKHLEKIWSNIRLLLNDTILQKGAMFSAKQSSDPCILAKSAELACAVLLPLVSSLVA